MHEAIARKGRKESNINQKRNKKNTKEIKGWYLNDKVVFQGKIGWISGFSSSSAYVTDIKGDYIQIPNKAYKQITLSKLKLICHNNNWQYSVGVHPPFIEDGGTSAHGRLNYDL